MTQTAVHHEHSDNAATFVSDDARAHWHDQSLWFIRSKRDKAASTLPEWEELRERASGIKLHTMSRLADYLEEFERNATRLGATVHWARTPAEHNQIVLDIIQKHGAKKVVKSKSMLTEECHLNPFLERNENRKTDPASERSGGLFTTFGSIGDWPADHDLFLALSRPDARWRNAHRPGG